MKDQDIIRTVQTMDARVKSHKDWLMVQPCLH